MDFSQGLRDSKTLWTSVGIGFGIGIPLMFYLRKKIQGYWVDRTAKMIKTDLTDKHVLITGGNSGIGLGSAIEFAKLNADITITVRSEAKGKAAVSEISKYYPKVTDMCQGSVTYEILDTSNVDSTNKFINRILAKSNNAQGYVIDYLILNAGIFTLADNCNAVTNDGLNTIFATNHFGHWMITYKLYDLLIKSGKYRSNEMSMNGRDDSWKSKYGAPIRVVAVSSGAHNGAAYGLYDKNNKNNLDNDKYFLKISKGTNKSDCQYSDSKLLNILHMHHLQRKLTIDKENDLIWCVAVTPGMVRSEIFNKAGTGAKVLTSLFYPLYWFITRSIHMGTQVILHVCGSNDPNIADGYYSNCFEKNAIDSLKRLVKGQHEQSQHLWDNCKQLLADFEKVSG